MTPPTTRTERATDPARWDVDTARRHAAALALWVSLASLGLMGFLWLAILISTWSARETALARTTADASNLSAALCEQVFQTLDTINATMDLTARKMRADPAGFRFDLWTRELPVLARPTIYAGLVDAQGRLVSTTYPTGTAGIDLSDRAHVKIHLLRRDAGLFVGEPVISRVVGQMMIHVSRRVEDAEGRLLGVLVFAVAPGELTVLHRSVDMGARGLIALVGLDGRLRARFGREGPDEPPVSMTGDWPVMPPAGALSGIVRSSAVDGVLRLYSLRQLPVYPLIVALGLNLDDELAESRAHGTLVIGIGIAASVLLFALNLLLVVEIRRRSQRETELAQEHAALEAARTELVLEQGKLAAVNRELVLSTARAEAANQAKSQFLAQMSHELRTPLHAVIGFSELILHQAPSPAVPDQTTAHASDIMKSGRHLLALINSILDLSKVESGTASLAEENVSMREIIEDSLVTIRGQALERDVLLDQRLPAALPWVNADATKLRQILINLLSNAVKFTPRGGSVTISARREPDGAFCVIVADTGIGMDDREVVIAMEPFGQVENSLARSFEGTGLGLPLARRLAELHGGHLTLRSVKGVGTTVEISLPSFRVMSASGARLAQDTRVEQSVSSPSSPGLSGGSVQARCRERSPGRAGG